MRESLAVRIGAHGLVDDEVSGQERWLTVEDVLYDPVDGVELVQYGVADFRRQLARPL